MHRKTPQNLQLFKSGLESRSYLAAIKENEKGRLDFLDSLKNHSFSYEDILELIQITQDKTVKSLLIIHLLSTASYLNNFKEASILTRLTNNDTHTPSRLNAFIHQLDLKILTGPLIARLQPEAAISILYSIPHFHTIQQEQVNALLNRYAKVEVITYWLYHFSSMPNAHYMLAHLYSEAEMHIWDEFKKMDKTKKESLITKMIEHLDLFNPANKVLQASSEESHLILSAKFYLNGHKNKAYVEYINYLASKLIAKKHPFSYQAITLLISLKGKQDFNEINEKTNYLISYNLRKNAHEGKVDLFYDKSVVNTHSLIQLIQCKALSSQGAKNVAHTKEEIDKYNPETSLPLIKENPLVEELIKREKPIKSFDYFLMHYEGDTNTLIPLVNDYLAFYTKENRAKSTQLTCMLLSRAEVNHTVKEAIFSSFLNFPELYDEQISNYLFQYDAKRFIQHFGMQGGAEQYKRVIQICTWALEKPHLLHDKERVTMANKAKQEATFELSLALYDNFITYLYNFVKRCIEYGWTGFFSPNAPVYVVPASSTAEPKKQQGNQDPNQAEPKQKSVKTPLSIIKALNRPYSVEKLDELIELLALYSLKANPQEETETRSELHTLFHLLLFEKKSDPTLVSWLATNQHQFIANRFRLIELLLQAGYANEDLLFSSIDTEFPSLQRIQQELLCPQPEQNAHTAITDAEIGDKQLESLEAVLGTVIESATDLGSKFVSSTQTTINQAAAFFSHNIPLSGLLGLQTENILKKNPDRASPQPTQE